MNHVTVREVTPEAFAPFGEISAPLAAGGHAAGEVTLDLSNGTPRLYLMRVTGRGLVFSSMARHDRVAQCLGVGDGKPWLVAVAAVNIAQSALSDIQAFRIPGDRFVKLALGTWHAGPYFAEAQRDFYNSEPVDTNTVDYTSYRLGTPVEFAL